MPTVITTMPIRHKVFSRLGTIQRPETFHYRLPNTSRPPSLHVDDFVAMETRSISAHQPGFKLPIQSIQVMFSFSPLPSSQLFGVGHPRPKHSLDPISHIILAYTGLIQ